MDPEKRYKVFHMYESRRPDHLRPHPTTPAEEGKPSSSEMWRGIRICVDCELAIRVKEFAARSPEERDEDPEYATVSIVHRDLKRYNKGQTWAHTGRHLSECQREIAEDKKKGLMDDESWKQRKVTARNKARWIASAFIKALEKGDMLKAFATAGGRFEGQMGEGPGSYRELNKLYEIYLQDPTNLDKREAVERAEEAFHKARDYTTMADDPQQVEYLKALDFVDAISADIRVYNVCRARTGWDAKRNVACSCGLAFPSKLWLQPNKARWQYRCRVDWKALIEEGSKEEVKNDSSHPVTRWIANLSKEYGDDIAKWKAIGCDSKFVPYAKGMSTVVEMRLEDDTWTAFAAERMPQELDDAIKGKTAEFHMAYKKLSPEELKAVIPVCFPMTHQIDPEIMPGIARYPVDDWEHEGEPCFDTKSWIKLCIKVANQDLTNLAGICAIAEKLEAKL